MLIFRLVFGLLLFAGILCFAMYVGTGQMVWRRRGVVIVKWTVIAALGFLLNMAVFTLTKQAVWRQRAILCLKWGVVLGLCFVGLLVLRRGAMFI